VKVSTSTLRFVNKHYGSVPQGGTPNGVDDLVKTIGAQLAAVEETVDFGKKFEGVVIVKIISCQDHPDADRLHVCKVDDGGKVQDVERDENGHVQIVCAAPNLYEGMLAPWLPPGSTVPGTVGKEPFVLDARDMRGVKSNGMLASPRELGLSDDHSGILDIDGDIAPGTMFVDAFDLHGDFVIDMENKMFTHRPDCFGWMGLAREIEGIQHRPFKSADWYRVDPAFPAVEAEELPFEVKNELPDLVPRFTAVALRGVKLGPSPVWLQIYLSRAGLRAINNVVDFTNYYMLLTGQPIHAYDYDKVKSFSGDKAVLTVRHPRPGEKIILLGGKEIEPRSDAMMVVAGDSHLACVGGALGGADTEVDDNTKNVIIEAATWDMYNIRRTAMTHGIFTDAVTRFTKGQSPLQNLAVTAKIVDELRQTAGAKVASPLVDINHVPGEAMQRSNLHAPVTVSTQFVNERLGWDLSAEEMQTLLTNVEFKVEVNGDDLTVTAPFWRTDIEIPEDIVEEVGRLNGYDKLLLDLPTRSLAPADRNPLLDLKNRIRQTLAAAGANEVLTYSFVHGNLLDKAGQKRDQAFQVANALSPGLQYYRLSLTPSLLELVHPNIKAGHDQFAVFELGKVHNKKEQDDEGLPGEVHALSLVFAASDRVAGGLSGAPYYYAKRYLMDLSELLGLTYDVRFEPLQGADLYNNSRVEQMVAPYQPGRSAILRDHEGLIWGVVGEYRAGVRKALKLPAFAAGFEVDPLLFRFASTPRSYAQLPKFPSVEQDICLKVPAGRAYAEVYDFVSKHLGTDRPDKTHHTLSPVDIYQREDDTDHKQITLRLSLASYDRTLTDQEVNTLLDQVASAAKDQLGAERI
jgi:phenylalanyl-tRNA synthetase beta chain